MGNIASKRLDHSYDLQTDGGWWIFTRVVYLNPLSLSYERNTLTAVGSVTATSSVTSDTFG
jgi:hypothetical protein